MTKIFLDQLLDIIERFPEGASIEQILLGLDPTTARRTLQRRLSALVKEGVLEAKGNARSRRYKLLAAPPEKPALVGFEVVVTGEGREIESLVSLALQKRRPVAYHRDFLESYEPNVTTYLPEYLRKKLYKIGSSEGNYPAGTYAGKIFHRLLIDLSWNSSRLEGNTYSLLETERLLEKGQPAAGKDLKETQMILNHKAAIEFLIQSAQEIGINRYTLLNLHTLLSDNLLPDPAASGRLRSIPVGIAHSVYRPLSIPQVIEECFNLLIHKANQIKDPFEQAFFLMVHIPYLQAFDDVNKRTSRLAANIPLIQNNLCPLSFVDVPDETYIKGLLGVYELNRIELLRDIFVFAYERSCIYYSSTRQSLGEPDPFRMEYRGQIREAVRWVVLNTLNPVQAIQFLRERSAYIPAKDRPRFIEIIEKELQGLHEGNIARYQLRVVEYETWKKNWDV